MAFKVLEDAAEIGGAIFGLSSAAQRQELV